jgi:isopenicillin-N N-acyltransferase-like protein
MPTQQLPFVSVSGSPYQMGRQHGEAAERLIRRTLRARADLAARATGTSVDAVVRAGLRYRPLVENRFPRLVEEVRGIAAGAGITFAEAFFIQVATEVSFRAAGCSAVAIRTQAADWIVAQNWDAVPEVRGTHIVLHLRPDDRPEAVMFTYAGVVGYMGVNAHGVCHVATQLLTSDWRAGVPHYFVKRRFLELASVEECLAAARRAAISSSATYILGDGARAVGIEWCPASMATFGGERFGHTNHLVDPRLRTLERCVEQLPDTIDRLARLRTLLPDALSLDGVRSILSDHTGYPASICRHGGAGGLHTLASVIFEPSRRRMHVAYGNPCATRYDT